MLDVEDTKEPIIVEYSQEELTDVLTRVKDAVSADDFRRVHTVFRAYLMLLHLVERGKFTISKLKRLLFGKKTEKSTGARTPGRAPVAPPDSSHPTPSAPKKGHGRLGADAYEGAQRVSVPHHSLHPGCRCPKCSAGTLYAIKEPSPLVRITGSPPLAATVYELERLRCSGCGTLFTARPPEGVGSEKYDATSVAMVALLKYGSGVPFFRLEKLHCHIGVPLPASTQWQIVNEGARLIEAVFHELVRQAAQGEVLHNDDTGVKILSLSKEREEGERSGTFTTGMVCLAGGRAMVLFMSGTRHAGENLDELLTQRARELPPPIQMCDALSRNTSGEFETILANCLSHARRKFIDVEDSWPDECRFLIDTLGSVYQHDAVTKKDKLSPGERLLYHQEHSKPLMDALHEWARDSIAQRKVEPNSGLGEALQYLMNHWEPLTLFLRVAGAPLDNNVCERALKRAILHRKNSLFYKTKRGALVGDLYMSLIHTAEKNGANPLHYLTELLRHPCEVRQSPADWMPWTYTLTIARLTEARGDSHTAAKAA